MKLNKLNNRVLNKNIFLILFSTIIILTLSVSSFALDWSQFTAFTGMNQPYAMNGPGCVTVDTIFTNISAMPGDNCINQLNGDYVGMPYDLGAVWVDLTKDYIAWQILGPAVFPSMGGQDSAFCGGDANNELIIAFDADDDMSTGCPPNYPCYPGADFQISSQSSGSTFMIFNNSLPLCQPFCSGPNTDDCCDGTSELCDCFSPDQNINTYRSNCSEQNGLMLAIDRSSIPNLVGLNFQVNVLPPEGGPVEQLGAFGMDLFAGTQQMDMMFMNEHPCFSYDGTSQTNCENNVNNIEGADNCVWSEFGSLCDPDFNDMECSSFCGACNTTSSCLTEGAKGSCMISDIPPMAPSDITQLANSPGKMCIEDPEKFIFGMGDSNCDEFCGDCYTESMCNNSKVPHPISGASQTGCKWFTDPVFGDSWCGIATLQMTSCSANQCGSCYTNTECSSVGCNWNSKLNLCYQNNSEICYNGLDDDGDNYADCMDSDCKSNIMCGGDLNILTGGYGTLDPLEALKIDLFTGMDGQPIVLAGDNCDDNLAGLKQQDIAGFGIKDNPNSFVFGIPLCIDSGNPMQDSLACGGAETGKYYYFLDSDDNQDTGCNITIGGNIQQGFEYKFVYVINNTGYFNETRFAYKCNPTTKEFVLKPIKVTGAPDIEGMGNPACDSDIAMIAVDKVGIGNPTGSIRLRIATSTVESNEINAADTIFEDLYYTPGSIDFEPKNCLKNPAACGTGFSLIGGGEFMPFEDCFPTGIDEDLDGSADCNDTDCYYAPVCEGQIDLSNDKKAPKVIMQDTDIFTDFALIFWNTDKPSNASIDFYGTNKCIGTKTEFNENIENSFIGFELGKFKPWHDVSITSGISASNTYFYKIKSCGSNGKCAISKCLNFTTPINDSNLKFKMNFLPGLGLNPQDPLGNLNFEFDTGLGYQDWTNELNSSIGKETPKNKNVSIKLYNPNSNQTWAIELKGADLTKAKEFNLTNAINVSQKGDNFFVGMEKNKFLDMAQGLGVDKIRLTIPSPGEKLKHCDNSGNNCKYVTDYANLINSSETFSTWDIPTSMGFSTYTTEESETYTLLFANISDLVQTIEPYQTAEYLIYLANGDSKTRKYNLSVFGQGSINESQIELSSGGYKIIKFSVSLSSEGQSSSYILATIWNDSNVVLNSSQDNIIMTTIVQDNAPILNYNKTSNANIGELITIDTNWTEATLTQGNMICELFMYNGTILDSKNSSSSWCNFTFQTDSTHYPSLSFYVRATDKLGHSTTSGIMTSQVNIGCNTPIVSDINLVSDVDCDSKGGLIIMNDELTIDCAGYTIKGSNSGDKGIFIDGNNSVIIKNCNISNFEEGIYVIDSINTTLENNILLYHQAIKSGIHVEDSLNMNIQGNDLRFNNVGITFVNTNNSKIVDNILDSNINKGISLEDSSNNEIYNNTLVGTTSTGYGIEINGNSNSIFKNNISNNVGYGIIIRNNSQNTKVYTNSIFGNNNEGIQLYVSLNLVPFQANYENKGNYWGHNNCPYFNRSKDVNNINVSDNFAYNSDNFKSSWNEVNPYSCKIEETTNISVNNGKITIQESEPISLYLTNISGLNSSEVIINILNNSEAGDIPKGNAFFYLNISAETNTSSEIIFKVLNSTFVNLGASTSRVFVHADHGNGYNELLSTIYLGEDGNYLKFSFNTTDYSIFVPSYIPETTTTIETTTTSSSSSGGGFNYIKKSLENELSLTRMNSGYRVYFDLKDEKHVIQIANLESGKKAKFKISSNVQYVEINVGETEFIDVNEDNKKDISIKLNEVTGYYANVEITKLEEEVITEETPSEILTTEIIEKEEEILVEEIKEDTTITERIEQIKKQSESQIDLSQENKNNTDLLIALGVMLTIVAISSIYCYECRYGKRCKLKKKSLNSRNKKR